jgi:hypothetical protein
MRVWISPRQRQTREESETIHISTRVSATPHERPKIFATNGDLLDTTTARAHRDGAAALL